MALDNIDDNMAGFDKEIAQRLMAAGHTLIPERRTYRHSVFKVDRKPDQVIRFSDGTALLDYNLEPVTAGMLHPERVDLACDEDGVIISQSAFQERWLLFIEATMVQGDPKSEPIPNVNKWVKQIHDPFGEGPGVVEAGYDARKPAPEDKTILVDPDRDEKTDLVMRGIETLLEANSTKRSKGK